MFELTVKVQLLGIQQGLDWSLNVKNRRQNWNLTGKIFGMLKFSSALVKKTFAIHLPEMMENRSIALIWQTH